MAPVSADRTMWLAWYHVRAFSDSRGNRTAHGLGGAAATGPKEDNITTTSVTPIQTQVTLVSYSWIPPYHDDESVPDEIKM